MPLPSGLVPWHIRGMPKVARCLAALVSVGLATGQQPVVAGRVLQRDGTSAAHAELRLRWRSAPELPGLCGRLLDDAGQVERKERADARGGFRLEVPHRGPFELVAAAGSDRSSPMFPVLAGAFVELQLAPPVVVAGTLLDEAGDPMPAVGVSFVPEQTAWSKLAAFRFLETRGQTRTDAAGRFELPFHDAYTRHRRFESFTVLAFDAPGVAASRHELLRPTRHCRELQIQLVPEAKADPRAPRRQAPGPQKSTEPAKDSPAVLATLRREGAPLANALVLWSEPASGAPPQEWLSRTDADGNVSATLGHREQSLLGFVQCDGVWRPFARVQVGATDLALGTVDVVSRPVRGQVLDATGQPVAGARLAVLSKVTMPKELPYVTYSDHGGRFCFESLPAGPLRIWADAGVHGFARAELQDGANEVVLRTPAEGVIQGEVIDSAGQPLPGAWLVLIRQGKDPELMPGLSEGVPMLCVHSDEAGRVRVAGLPEGRWQVIGNAVRDGSLFGGGVDPVAVGGEFRLAMKYIPE